jgi:type I restriction enzyme S subunit
MTPEGWRQVLLGSVADVQWGNTSLTKASYVPQGFCAFSASGRDGLLPTYGYDGDGVVLSAIGARCGRCFLAQGRWTAIKNTITVTAAEPGQTTILYLFQYLNRDGIWPSNGGAQPFIGLGQARNVLLVLPPVPEQRKIAAILSSVDDAIGASQAVIDQLQVVKKAMMAELLTKGLPGRHKKFKQTEIGAVPEEWEAVLLDSVARRGSGHTPDKKHPEYWNGEIKWVSLKDSWQLDRLYIEDTEAKITPLGIANSSAVEHPPGTVVLSRDAGVGKSAITTGVMAVSQHFMAWVCGPRLDNHFLYYWLQKEKPEFERIAIGNTIKTIGVPYFKALQIPLPPVDEQRAISQILVSTDQRLFAEEEAQASRRQLKSALMSVLLTGEVRVRVDKDAAA